MAEGNKIINPILKGFYPDPSICRAGEDFYLVCSSFELCPGIPIFHSKDLANWEQIGYVMDITNGFHVSANTFDGGVMAPTIRYHDGLFYVINMNYSDKGNFIVTAEDPAGPWSEPHWLEGVEGLDASIFFDDDGKTYLVGLGKVVERADGTMDDGIWVQELDLKGMKTTGEKSVIWDSALRVGKYPESPHIYKIGDYYHLIIAEGGTEYNHSVVTARSRDLRGWYEGNPANPVLSHRQLGPGYPINNIGHADIVDTPDGNWYAVMLGVRGVEGNYYNLGRETFICPVEWYRDWPFFSPGYGKVEWSYDADPSLQWTPYESEPARDGFDSDKLGMQWNFWGTPYQSFWKLENSCLKLKCLPKSITSPIVGLLYMDIEKQRTDCVSFVARRQLDMDYSVTCSMRFSPENAESAGLDVIHAMNHQFRLERVISDGRQVLRAVQVTTKVNGPAFMPDFECETAEDVLAQVPYDGDEIILRISAKGQDYTFSYGSDENNMKIIYEHADGREMNPEYIGCYTGMMIGMFASANGNESDNQAEFDWFEYLA